MKINKIYISAFGGLKDFTLELCEGFNVIYGENENGKSTVAAFIKCMFYGTGRNSQQLSQSMRQKYTPWNGGVMGGRIYFEHEGKNYCLEREFRKSDSTDRMVLTDLDSGISESINENIGPKFFGIGAQGFERSMFIGSSAAFTKDADAVGQLNARLSNLAFTGDEDVSYRLIAKRLEDAKFKIISKSGKTGAFAEEALKLKELENKLSKADDAAHRKAQIKGEIEAYAADFSKLQTEYDQLKSVIDNEADIRNRDKLIDFIETENALKKVNLELRLKDGSILAKPFVAAVNFGITKYEKIASRCEEVKKDIDAINESLALQIEKSPEEIKTQLDSLGEKATKLEDEKEKLSASQQERAEKLESLQDERAKIEKNKTAVNPIFSVLSILFAALTVLGYYLWGNLGAICFVAVAAIFLVLSLTVKPNSRSTILKLEKEINEISSDIVSIKGEKTAIQEQINNLTAQMNMLSTALSADAAVRAQRQADLNAKQNTLSQEIIKRDAAICEVLQYFGRYKDVEKIEDVSEILPQLIEKTEKQGELKLKISLLKNDLGDITADEANKRIEQLSESNENSGVDFENLKADFEVLSAKLNATRDKITALNTELKTAFKTAETPEDIKREIKLCKEKMLNQKSFYEAAQTALDVLEESFNEVRRGYGSEVENLTIDIFSRLTGGRYNRISISKSLDMAVESSTIFGTREIDYLSQGTVDQAYLSLRLAISRLIAKNGSLPIILDDSLSQYDDRRTATAISFLKEFCTDTQGVLFTCHNSICEAAKKIDIEIKTPFN